MIKLQLLDMSDSLPPLSKFIYGFKLDPWQKRVLNWIENDKSVIICAPTSSGKTVLSSFVALIGKHKKEEIDAKKTDGDKNDDDDEYGELGEGEEGDDEEEEGGGERQEDEEEYQTNLDIVQDLSEAEPESDNKNDIQDSISNIDNITLTENNRGDRPEDLEAFQAQKDRLSRLKFRDTISDGNQRILFVVPSEPLVWQVAAYFSQLLQEEGDKNTKVI